jgi:hypothetical protein
MREKKEIDPKIPKWNKPQDKGLVKKSKSNM